MHRGVVVSKIILNTKNNNKEYYNINRWDVVLNTRNLAHMANGKGEKNSWDDILVEHVCWKQSCFSCTTQLWL